MELTDSELQEIADEIGVKVSKLQSEAVKDCAESVQAENPDLDKSSAFAICQDMENQGLLAEPTHLALAEQRDPGRIERTEEGDTVRYSDIMLLAPGVWGDAGSGSHFLYSEDETIPMLAENISGTTINLFHERENEVTDVGELDEDSIFIGDEDGALYGDLVLHMDNSASEFADDAMQNALETGGREGLQGPSLEIAGQEHQHNREAGVPELIKGEIIGAALVGLGVTAGPGSEDAAFEEQTADRAVALAQSGGANVLMRRGNNKAMDVDKLRGELEGRGIQLAEDVDTETIEQLAKAFDISLQEDEDDDEDEDEPEEGEASDDDGGDDDDEDDGEEMDMAELSDEIDSIKEQVASNAERIEAIADATEALQEGEVELSELSESVTELADSLEDRANSDRVDELEQRLEDIEDEPEDKASLADVGGGPDTGEVQSDQRIVELGNNTTNREL